MVVFSSARHEHLLTNKMLGEQKGFYKFILSSWKIASRLLLKPQGSLANYIYPKTGQHLQSHNASTTTDIGGIDTRRSPSFRVAPVKTSGFMLSGFPKVLCAFMTGAVRMAPLTVEISRPLSEQSISADSS